MCFGRAENNRLFIDVDREEPPKNGPAKKVGIGVAIAAIVVIGAIVGAYFLFPGVHTFINKVFSHIQSAYQSVRTTLIKTQLAGWKALCYIALPLAGLALTIGTVIHAWRKHKRRVMELDKALERPRLKETLKEMLPTRKQLRIACIVGTSLGLLALIAVAIFTWNPTAHTWYTHHLHPGLQGAFCTPMALWKGLAYAGGGTAVVSMGLGGAFGLAQLANQWRKETQEMEMCRLQQIRERVNALKAKTSLTEAERRELAQREEMLKAPPAQPRSLYQVFAQ